VNRRGGGKPLDAVVARGEGAAHSDRREGGGHEHAGRQGDARRACVAHDDGARVGVGADDALGAAPRIGVTVRQDAARRGAREARRLAREALVEAQGERHLAQRRDDVARARGPLGGVLVEELRHEIGQGGRHARPVEPWGGLLSYGGDDVGVGGSVEEAPSREAFPQDDAGGEQVRAGTDFLSPRLLGCHVRELALHLAGHRDFAFERKGRDAEIRQLDAAIITDEHVAGRHVAMDDVEGGAAVGARPVRGIERAKEWQCDRQDAFDLERRGRRLQDVAEVRAVDVLEDEERPGFVFSAVEEANDVLVIEGRVHRSFVREQPQEARIETERGTDPFDDDSSAVVRLRAGDECHASFGQQAHLAVAHHLTLLFRSGLTAGIDHGLVAVDLRSIRLLREEGLAGGDARPLRLGVVPARAELAKDRIVGSKIAERPFERSITDVGVDARLTAWQRHARREEQKGGKGTAHGPSMSAAAQKTKGRDEPALLLRHERTPVSFQTRVTRLRLRLRPRRRGKRSR
jgi:hypothetical protein